MESPLPPMPLQGRRVLLVEDEALVAFFLQDVLEEEGCLVIGPAASLREALALATIEPAPDAAVLDLNLRGEPAWPVTEVLARRGVPFVIASGYGGLDAARGAAAVAVLTKPLSPAQLVRAVTDALARGNTAATG